MGSVQEDRDCGQRLRFRRADLHHSAAHYDGAALLLATLFFSVQIYCDFSGYTDMALGFARMMGYELVINFRQPYFSRSVGEFWRRWHISLSTWFRDYLYIPLGGNRVEVSRNYFNLMVTFVVSGLWHGANWTFVAWGFLHGLYLIVAQTRVPSLRGWRISSVFIVSPD